MTGRGGWRYGVGLAGWDMFANDAIIVFLLQHLLAGLRDLF
jgi:hypothetical protein